MRMAARCFALQRMWAVARLLLEAGTLPNLGRNRYGATALMIAVEWRREDMVKLLLEYGADTEIRDKKGRAPLLLAAHEGDLEIVRHLVKSGANLETEDRWGRTPLSWAGWNRHDKVVKYLLEAHVDPSAILGRKPSTKERALRYVDYTGERWFGVQFWIIY